MPTFQVAEQQDELSEGQYAAIVRSIEPAIVDPNRPPSKYGDKPQQVITYELTEVEREDGSAITRREWVNEVGALTPKSKFYDRFSNVLNGGQPLDKAASYATEDLLGKPCLIFWGAYVGDDGTSKMKILKVSPPKKAAVAAGVRRRTVEEPDADAEAAAEIANI